MSAAQVLCCLLVVFSGSSCQEFYFTGNVSYSHLCGRWTVTGSVTLTPQQLKEYGSEVIIQTATGDWGVDRVHTTRRLCVVDLTRPPSGYIADVEGDICDVISKTDDVYNIRVSTLMHSSDGDLTLQAALRFESRGFTTVTTKNIGRIPLAGTASSQPTLTYKIGNGQVQEFGSNSSALVAVCRNSFVPVRFCAENASEGSVLKIYANGQKTESDQVCVETGYRSDALDTTARNIKFEYEDLICLRHKDLIVTVTERPASECDVICPGETTPTNITNACRRRPGSKARQIVRLYDGSDVMCDTQTAGGNWVVFQRRNSSDVDFYRGWYDYRAGFGNLSTNFWLGLDKIHTACSKVHTCELRVDLRFKGKNYQATYQDFYLGGPEESFRLHIGSYSGDAGDALIRHGNGHRFSTTDNDHDSNSVSNCATAYTGAWWYDSCHEANLNGAWGSKEYGKGLNWKPTTGYHDSVTLSEMKFRHYLR